MGRSRASTAERPARALSPAALLLAAAALLLSAASASAQTTSPADPGAVVDSLMAAGQYREAEHLLDTLLRPPYFGWTMPEPAARRAGWHFLRGVVRQRIGDTEGDTAYGRRADTDYLRAAELDAALAPRALNNRARIAEARGDLPAALYLYRRAAEGPDPLRPIFLVNRGLVFEAAGQPDSAFHAYREALAEDPSLLSAHRAILAAALRHRPADVPALARDAAGMGFTDEAQAALADLLAGDAAPDDATAEAALIGLATLLAERDYDAERARAEAVPLLLRIGARRPALAAAVDELSRAYDGGDGGAAPPDSTGWWTQSLDRYRPYSEILRRLGDRALAAGRADEAGRRYLAALAAPRFDAVWRNDNAWIPGLALAERGNEPALLALRARLEAARTGGGASPDSLWALESLLAGISARRGEDALARAYATRVAAVTERWVQAGRLAANPPEVVAVLYGQLRARDRMAAERMLAVEAARYHRMGMSPAPVERLSAIQLDSLMVRGPAARLSAEESPGLYREMMRAATVEDVAVIGTPSLVTRASGAAAGSQAIALRGTGGFNTTLADRPLTVVDGVVQADPPASLVRPEDIEAVEVLRGPAAAARYGSHAAGGVLLIRTRRGGLPRPAISLGAEQGAAALGGAADRIAGNWGVHPTTGDVYVLDLLRSERERGSDVFRRGRLQSYDGSATGRLGGIAYVAGGRWTRAEGIERPNVATDHVGRVRLGYEGGGWTASASLQHAGEDATAACEGTCGGVLFSTVFADPAAIEEPNRGFLEALPDTLWARRQPSRSARRLLASASVGRERGNVGWNVTGGWDAGRTDAVRLRPRIPAAHWDFPLDHPDRTRWTEGVESRRGSVDASVRLSGFWSDAVEGWTTMGVGFARERTYLRAMYLPDEPGDDFSSPDTLFRTGFLSARQAYGLVEQQLQFRDRAALTAGLRADRESLIPGWQLYPKLSASVDALAEPVGALDALRLRVAYGEVGGFADDLSLLRFYLPALPGDTTPFIALAHPGLRPERASEMEITAQTSWFDGGLTLEATHYRNRTRDGLLLRHLPPSMGILEPRMVNLQSVRHSGTEVRLEARPVDGRDLRISLTASAALHRSRVEALGDADPGSGFVQVGSQRWVPGFAPGAWFERRVVSTWLDDAGVARDVMCDAGDPDGRLLPDGTPLEPGGPAVPCVEAPRLFLGNSAPRATGTLVARIERRPFTAGAVLEWRAGYRKLDANLLLRCGTFHVCEENFFPERFDSTHVAEVQSNGEMSAFAIRDASFLRLREVSLAFAVPAGVVRRMGASGATLSVRARNVALWTGWTGLDPETELSDSLLRPVELAVTPPLAQILLRLDVTL